MAPAGNKAKRLSSVNHTTKTILLHHHHHHYHHISMMSKGFKSSRECRAINPTHPLMQSVKPRRFYFTEGELTTTELTI